MTTTPHLPALGQVVLYVLDMLDVEVILQRRAQAQAAAIAAPVPGPFDGGSDVHSGDVLPATVVRIRSLDPDAGVSLRVLLDGTDLLWANDRMQGTAPGTWHWPPRA